MRALSKLIYLNNPDLVLFVGEALVGNDAVDQLSKFNQVQDLTQLYHPKYYYTNNIICSTNLLTFSLDPCRNWPTWQLRPTPD